MPRIQRSWHCGKHVNVIQVRAVLDTTGGGYVYLADPYAAFENSSVALNVSQFLEDLGYRKQGDRFLLQASAKFWFANCLGSLTVFPLQLATLSVHEMMQAHEHYERYSGDLAFLLPVSSTGGSKKKLFKRMDPPLPGRSFVVVAPSFCKIHLSCPLKSWEGLGTLTMIWMLTWEKHCFALWMLRTIRNNCDNSVFYRFQVLESTYATSSVPRSCPMALQDCGSTWRKTRLPWSQSCRSCERPMYLARATMTNLKCSELWRIIRKDLVFHPCRHLMALLLAFCRAWRPIRPKGESLKSGSELKKTHFEGYCHIGRWNFSVLKLQIQQPERNVAKNGKKEPLCFCCDPCWWLLVLFF